MPRKPSTPPVPESASKLVNEAVSRLLETARKNPRGEDPAGVTKLGRPERRIVRAAREAEPAQLAQVTLSAKPTPARSPEELEPGRYDFDLAEYPFGYLDKKFRTTGGSPPLVYRDTITSPAGEPVVRTWTTYPSPHGFPGPSAQRLFYELLQLYIEQGAVGSQIRFGTVCNLYRRMHGGRNPSRSEYNSIDRDLETLAGLRFKAENAFWDRRLRAYVDMKMFSLFGTIFKFKERPTSFQEELPFGFVEASSILQMIAQTRGFFCIGFDSELFHGLSPAEQRLSVYLAKKFIFQKRHWRTLSGIAQALPLTSAKPKDVQRVLRRTANGLLERGVPFLQSFEFTRSERTGEQMVVFHRRRPPRQDYEIPQAALESLDPALQLLIQDLAEAAGDQRRKDIYWWTECARRLGPNGVHAALSQHRDRCRQESVRSRGALLTRILQDQAVTMGIALPVGRARGLPN